MSCPTRMPPEKTPMSTYDNWTIPNLITVARIILVPVFIMLFLDQRFALALLVFLVAGLSDGLDGFLARVLHQRTQLGAMLDPLADKLLVATAYVCLGMGALIPSWLAVLVVSRDMLIVGGLALLHFWGVSVRDRIAPTVLSKINTCGQIALIVAVLAQYSFALPWQALIHVLIVTATVTTTLSGAHYIFTGLGLFPGTEQDGGKG